MSVTNGELRERLRFGIIAPEFPPSIGGMETLARGIASALTISDDVSVFTFDVPHDGMGTSFRVLRTISGALFEDARRLRGYEAEIDVWLALNAGLLPIVPMLAKPAFAYLHGNDFLAPWIGYGSWWLEAIRKPYMSAVRHAIRRSAVRRAASSVRHAFTNSRRTAELAQQHLGLSPQSVSVCPPGVDDRFFQAREEISDRTLRLLTVTRLTKYSARKNVEGVLTAIASLKDRLSLRYAVVGDGDDRARLEDVSSRLGIRHLVDFRGKLDNAELLAEYRRSDLFVLAAKAAEDDVEGFGIVYLEAAAAGVPSICSREGGAVDAVEAGRNGIVLDTSSPADIAAGIVEFAQTRDRYRQETVRGVAERYRWPGVAAQLRGRITATLDASLRAAMMGRSGSPGFSAERCL